TLPPAALFQKACELKLRVLSLTDHDSTAGLEALEPLARQHPEIRLIPGLEMSAEGELTCHLLGYFVEMKSKGFQETLADLRKLRQHRIQAMTKKVNEMGMAVDVARVLALAAGGSVGRPHLADAMVERGHVKT